MKLLIFHYLWYTINKVKEKVKPEKLIFKFLTKVNNSLKRQYVVVNDASWENYRNGEFIILDIHSD